MNWLNETRRIAGILALSIPMLAASGCGGSGGGGTIIPPPKTIKLTNTAPYNTGSRKGHHDRQQQ